MSAKWTEGPWEVDGPPHNQIVWRDANTRICFLAHSNGADDARDLATGKLIAAAPDLAGALKNLVGLAKMRGTLTGYGAAIADAEAALAKAGAT